MRSDLLASIAVAALGIGGSCWLLFMPIIEICRLGNLTVIQANACVFFYYETSD